MKYKNKYVSIDFDEVNKIAFLKWNDNTIFMSDKEYLKITQEIFKITQNLEMKFFLNDMQDFKAIISLELQEKLKKNFLQKLFSETKLKKIAIVLPKDYTARISVFQLFEDALFTDRVKFFDTQQNAEVWLLFDLKI